MKTNLVNGNLDAAMNSFASGAAGKYRQAFLVLGTNETATVILQIPALTPVVVESDSAQYRFDRVIEAITITFPVEFIMEKGIWTILDY